MSDPQDTAPTPIIVPASAINDQLASALRVFLVALGAYGAGKGWFDRELFAATIPLLMIGGPLVWAQLKARASNASAVTMANHLSDKIATVR